MADEQLSTLSVCWRLERRDGVAIGLTAHDRDLSIGGLIYRAAPGMTPTAVKRTDSLDADNMEASGPLSHDSIREADLLAGRWDGARIAAFVTDWSAEVPEPVSLGTGTIGSVEIRDGSFSAELRGIAAMLAAPVNEETSPSCRATLGDRRCRVAMGGRRRVVTVTAVADAQVTVDTSEPETNAYAQGRLRWLTGANSGLEQGVMVSEGSTLTLREPPPYAGAGVRVELIEGCDRRFGTCAGRFANALNFQGEPHLPGIDLLTRYPGA